MSNTQRFSYIIDYKIDDTNLKNFKKQLESIQKINTSTYAKINGNSTMSRPGNGEKLIQPLREAQRDARVLERALQSAYNPKLKTYDILKFNNYLKQNGKDFQLMQKNIQNLGATGNATINSLNRNFLNLRTATKESYGYFGKIAEQFANSISFTAFNMAVRSLVTTIKQSYNFTKNLDSELNDIRIVTGKSADEMARFAQQANNVSKSLGKGTQDYVKAALIYAQQGLGDEEIKARTAITLKTANVTGQSASRVSEELTAVWNGYKVTAKQAEVYIDRIAAVASTTASNLQELSTGMSKVASAAAALGVGEDQLAAQLSTIISVTRQAPQSVGTALRTVYARITDIKAGIDEQGVSLGEYSGKMAQLGVNVLDSAGNLRNMGEVMQEIGGKWSTLTREQQIYLAQTMAGQRQYSNLIALFDNFDKYNSALQTAQNSAGTLSKQQEIYMDRLESHVKQLSTETENMWMNLVDTNGMKQLIDNLTQISKLVTSIIQGIGGGSNLILPALSLLGGAMAPHIGRAASAGAVNRRNEQLQAERLRQMEQQYRQDPVISANPKLKDLIFDTIRMTKGTVQSPKALQRMEQSFSQIQHAASTKEQSIEGLRTGLMEATTGSWETYKKSPILIEGKEQQIGERDFSTISQEEYDKIIKGRMDYLESQIAGAPEDYKELVQSLRTNQQEIRSKIGTSLSRVPWFRELDDGKIKQDVISRILEGRTTDLTDKDIQRNANKYLSYLEENKSRWVATRRKQESIEQYRNNARTLSNISEYQRLQQLEIRNQTESLVQQRDVAEQDEKASEYSLRTTQTELYGVAVQNLTTNFTKMASGAGLAASSLMSFSNAIKILQNDDISPWEKFLQVITSIGFGLSNLVNGVGGLIAAYRNISQSEETRSLFNKQLNTDLQRKIIQRKREALAINESTEALNINTQAEGANAAAKRTSPPKVAGQPKGPSEPIPTDGKPIPTDGKPIPTDGKPIPTDGKPIPTDGKPIPTDGSSDNSKQNNIQANRKIVSRRSKKLAINRMHKVKPIRSEELISKGLLFPRVTVSKELPKELLYTDTDLDAYVEQNNFQSNKKGQPTGPVVSYDTKTLILRSKDKRYAKILGLKNEKDAEQPTKEPIPTNGSPDNISENGKNGENIKQNNPKANKKQMSTKGALAVMGIAISAAGATIAILDHVSKIYDKNNQKQIQSQKKLMKIEEQRRQKLTSQLSIVNQFKTLNNQYKEGTITSSQLRDKISELNEQYKEESSLIREITQNYLSMGDAISEVEKRLLQERISSTERELKYQEMIATRTGRSKSYGDEIYNQYSISSIRDKQQNKAIIQTAAFEGDTARRLGQILAEGGQGQVKGASLGLHGLLGIDIPWSVSHVALNQIKNKEDLEKQIELLRKYVDTATDSEKNSKNYASAMELLSQLEEQNKIWNEKIDSVLKDRSEVGARAGVQQEFYQGIKTSQDYSAAYSKAMAVARKQAEQSKDFQKKTKQEQNAYLTQAVDKILQENGYSGLQDKYQEGQKVIQQIQTKYEEQLSEEDKQTIFNMTSEQRAYVLKRLNKQGMESLGTFENLGSVLEEISQRSFDNIKLDPTLAKKAAIEYNNMADAIEKIQKGKGFSSKEFEQITDPEIKEYFREDLQGNHVLKNIEDKEKVLKMMNDAAASEWRKNYKNKKDVIAYEKGFSQSEMSDARQMTKEDLSNVDNLQLMIDRLRSVQGDEELSDFLNSLSETIEDEGGTLTIGQQDLLLEKYNEIIANHQNGAKILEEATQESVYALDQLYEALYPKDKDVDETLLMRIAQQYKMTGFADFLKQNKQELYEAAEGAARYELAIRKLKENYDSWLKVLQGGNQTNKLEKQDQIQDFYNKYFNLETGTKLSEEFLFNENNLKKAKQIISTNDKDSYKDFMNSIRQSIIDKYEFSSEAAQKEYKKAEKNLENLAVNAGKKVEGDQLKQIKGFIETLISLGETDEKVIKSILKTFGVEVLFNIEDGIVSIDSAIGITFDHIQQSLNDQLEEEKKQLDAWKMLPEFLKDDRDIYHEINIELADQERILSRIQKNQDKLYGQQALNNFNKQLAMYREEEKILLRKQKMQQQDLKNRQMNLSSRGAIFDQSGNISNYNALITQAMNNVQNIIAQQRGMTQYRNDHLDMAGTELLEFERDEKKLAIQKEKADKVLDDLKTDLDKYETIKKESEQLVDKLSEVTQKRIEINLQKFDLKVKVAVDFSEVKKAWEDFRRNVLEHDDIFNPNELETALRNSTQNLGNISAIAETLPAINENIYEALKWASKFEDANYNPENDENQIFKTQGQARSKVEELMKQAAEARKNILSEEDAIKKIYLESFNILSKLFDKQKDQYTFIDEQLKHDKQLVELVFGTKNYQINKKYFDEMVKNQKKQLESVNNQIKIYAKLQQEALAAGNQAAADAANEAWRKAIKERNDLQVAAIQNLKQEYSNAIDEISAKMEKSLTNGQGFDYLDLDWQLMKKRADIYLDTINSAFGVKNVETTFNEAINNTDDLYAQQSIRDVMNQQLDILREKEKLTKYDIDRALKILDIEKARLALEEARNNKTQMRLKRDSQGNYSYQFVANQDEIDKAQKELNKAQNDLYNFDKDNYESTLKQAYDMTKEYRNKISELNKNYWDADEEGRKQILEQISLLEKEYIENTSSLFRQNEYIKQNLFASTKDNYILLLDESAAKFEEMTNLEEAKWLEDMVPAVNSGIAQMIGRFSEDEDSFKNIVIDATEEMNNERQKYQDGLDQLEKVADQDFNNIKKVIDPVVNQMNQLVIDNDTLKTQADEIATEMNKLAGEGGALSNLKNAWLEVYKQTNNAVEKANEYLRTLAQLSGKNSTDNITSGETKIGGGKKTSSSTPDLIQDSFISWTPSSTFGGTKVENTKDRKLKDVYSYLRDHYTLPSSSVSQREARAGHPVKSEETIKNLANAARNNEAAKRELFNYANKHPEWFGLEGLENPYKKIISNFLGQETAEGNTNLETDKMKEKQQESLEDYIKTLETIITKKSSILRVQKRVQKTSPPEWGKWGEWTQSYEKYSLQDIPESDQAILLSNINWDGYPIEDPTTHNFDGSTKGPYKIRYGWDPNSEAYQNLKDKYNLYHNTYRGQRTDKEILRIALNRVALSSLDTGGYTGAWGDSSGRLAVLHQKELVLNAKDTQNMLNAVTILRQMETSLKDRISQLTSSMPKAKFNSNTDEIKQNVNISAVFPNVNSKKEIEEAFTELVNAAAQRALRLRNA